VRLLLDTVVLILRSRVTTTTHETRDHSFAKYRKHPRTDRIPLSEIAIKAALGKLGLSEADARLALEDLNLRRIGPLAGMGEPERVTCASVRAKRGCLTP